MAQLATRSVSSSSYSPWLLPWVLWARNCVVGFLILSTSEDNGDSSEGACTVPSVPSSPLSVLLPVPVTSGAHLMEGSGGAQREVCPIATSRPLMRALRPNLIHTHGVGIWDCVQGPREAALPSEWQKGFSRDSKTRGE